MMVMKLKEISAYLILHQSECNPEQNLNEVLKIAICMTNFPFTSNTCFMHFFSAGWRRIRSRVQLRYRGAAEHLQDAGPP